MAGFAVGFLGCSDDASAPEDAATGDAGGSVSAPDAESSERQDAAPFVSTGPLHGAFSVKLQPAVPSTGTTPAMGAATSIVGKLFDGPQPPTMPVTLAMEQDGCQLWEIAHPLCTEDCGQSVCTGDDVCTAFPEAQDVGTVRVRGLGDQELNVEPIGSSPTYTPNAMLPFPPCAEGDPIVVEADAFSVASTCIEPLVVESDDAIPILTGQAAPLSWVPAGQPELASVRIVVDISRHGGAKGEVACEVPDTGSFEIPEPVVSGLVALGVAGFPTVVLTRVAMGTSPEQENVKLSVSSPVERPADTGVVSCVPGQDGCEAGTTCQADWTCR